MIYHGWGNSSAVEAIVIKVLHQKYVNFSLQKEGHINDWWECPTEPQQRIRLYRKLKKLSTIVLIML
mgnify:CR=1 FL=1